MYNRDVVKDNIHMKEKTAYYVYMHTCPNYKVYVGMSKNPVQRWNKGNGYKYNNEFYKDIQKYGWDNIKHEIILKTYYGWVARMNEKKLITQYRELKRSYNLVNEENAQSYKSKRKIPLKKVGKYTKQGELIKIYDSASEAWRDGNINADFIRSCCRGRIKTSGGYIWKYL